MSIIKAITVGLAIASKVAVVVAAVKLVKDDVEAKKKLKAAQAEAAQAAAVQAEAA